MLGLLAALFIPRRRIWVQASVQDTSDGRMLRLEYAGLARGEDPTLGGAVEQIAQRHRAALEPLLREQLPASGSPADESGRG